MLTHGISYSHEDYEVESFSRLLMPLDIPFDVDFAQPFLEIPHAVIKSVEKLLASINRPFVTVFPGASIAERRWGENNFRQLAERLMAAGLNVVVVGGEDDQVQGEVITRDGGLNLAGGTSLTETAAILGKSALLVSGDSGILHLAVGLAVPTVSLFGPGITEKWAPQGDIHRVVTHVLDCSPCTRFGTTPPCPVNARCLAEITVDEVFSNVQALIATRKS
jgi:ADP-heptose:LPS heptosyltransferase